MMFLPVILLLAFLAVTCTAQDVFTSPDLLELLNEIEDMSHDEYFADVRQSGLAQTAEVCRTAQADMVFDMLREPNTATPRKKLGLTLNLNIRPVVLAHGMGDTGYGYGMQSMVDTMRSNLNGTYVVAATLGKNAEEDSQNSFFKTMDQQVDLFAQFVRADPYLKHGFNAIGNSQGNLVIRGYIEKFNDPPVFNFISVHGPMMGVSMVPKCDYSSTVCTLFNKIFVGGLAYFSFAQNMVAQSNYYRNPMDLNTYKHNCKFLPAMNNESRKRAPHPQYASNFASLENLVLIKAEKDTMVIPSESSWFGFFQDKSTTKKWTMEQAPWYSGNNFGLKTLNEAGKIHFEEIGYDHLCVGSYHVAQLAQKYGFLKEVNYAESQ